MTVFHYLPLLTDPITWKLEHTTTIIAPSAYLFIFIHSFLSFQLLGHLLIVAKNVATQESLTEGYRVGKRPALVANKNPPAVNFVHTEFTSFCPLQWLMMENTVLSQFTTFMSTCWEEDRWHGLLDNSDPVNMSALMCNPFEHMMNIINPEVKYLNPLSWTKSSHVDLD